MDYGSRSQGDRGWYLRSRHERPAENRYQPICKNQQQPLLGAHAWVTGNSRRSRFTFSCGIPHRSWAKQFVVLDSNTNRLPSNDNPYLPTVPVWYSTSTSPSCNPKMRSESAMIFNNLAGASRCSKSLASHNGEASNEKSRLDLPPAFGLTQLSCCDLTRLQPQV